MTFRLFINRSYNKMPQYNAVLIFRKDKIPPITLTHIEGISVLLKRVWQFVQIITIF